MIPTQETNSSASLNLSVDCSGRPPLEPSQSDAFIEALKTLSNDEGAQKARQAVMPSPAAPCSEERARMMLTEMGEFLAASARARWESEKQVPKSFFDFLASYDRSNNHSYYNYFIRVASKSCVRRLTSSDFPPQLAWVAFAGWARGIAKYISSRSDEAQAFCAGGLQGVRSKTSEFASSLANYLSALNSISDEFTKYRVTHEPARGVTMCTATCDNILACLRSRPGQRNVSRKKLSSACRDISRQASEIAEIAGRMEEVLENDLIPFHAPVDPYRITRYVRAGGEFPERTAP